MKDFNLLSNYDGWPKERKPDEQEKKAIKEEQSDLEEETADNQVELASDPDIGHLEAERIIKEKSLQDLLDKKEREEIEAAREEDRQDLEDTYRRF